MTKRVTTSFLLNGERKQVTGEVNRRLLDLLREDFGLTGTKEGCGQGDCGSCSVLLDGQVVKACQTSLGKVAGKAVTTIEGIGSPTEPHPLQLAFVETGAVQCGFCTPGIVIRAKALLDQNPRPTREEVVAALSGNLCRCTGYVKIIEGVLRAAELLAGVPPARPDYGDQIVGARVLRPDALPKSRGSHTFAADLRLGGMLHGKVLRSRHLHARILNIDTSEAERLPGVEAVLTAKDLPGPNRVGYIVKDERLLADDKVRWLGDPVALVAATSERIARKALSLIKVDYQPLEAVRDPFAALEEGAPQVHDGGNVLATQGVVKGDVERGFREADVIVENRLTTPFIEHAYLEPEAGLAYIDEEGRVVVRHSSQGPHRDQRDIAEALAVDPSRVRVIPTSPGGSFGLKSGANVHLYTALLAHRLRKPVKMVLSRQESLVTSIKRHPFYMHCRLGATREGRLTALQMDYVMDTGSYASLGPVVAMRSALHAAGPYDIPHVKVQSKAVYTNNPIAGPMRGFGTPQLQFALESQMDMLAERLGMDPWELRMLNALEQGSKTVTGQVPESIGFKRTLEAVRGYYQEMLGAAREANRPDPAIRRGVGLGCMWYGLGMTARSNVSEAHAELDNDGKVRIFTGASEVGQGVYTVLAQIAAQEMGLPFNAIEVVGGDTDLTPDAQQAAASRQTWISGNAVKQASGLLRDALLNTAARVLEQRAEDLSFREGRLVSAADPSLKLPLAKLAAFCREAGTPLRYAGRYEPPMSTFDRNTGQGAPFHSYVSGTQLVELEVNLRNGAVKVLRVVNAQDVGKAINPLNVEGQLQGAVVMGLGFALYEEFIPDRTRRLAHYHIPTTLEVPEIVPIMVEEPAPSGPFGAKGAGEAAMIPTAPAVTNAIYHACGARVCHLPATPGRVLQALKEQRR